MLVQKTMSDVVPLHPEKASGPPAPSRQYLDVPVLTDWRSTDSVQALRQILIDHERGSFIQSAMLADEMMTDDRIAGCINTRIGGILSAPLTFKPADDRKKSTKLATLLGGADETASDGAWLSMVDYDTAYALLKWKILLGVAIAEIVWFPMGGVMFPRLVAWHPRALWWNWAKRVFQVATAGLDPSVSNQPLPAQSSSYMLDLPRTDGEVVHTGQWFVWGRQYSWMHGLVRSLGMKFIDRTWNERDWSRYCEKHGLAIIEGKVPSGTDTGEKQEFEARLANLGNEPTIITPQATDGEPCYGFQLHEATSKSWETFQARKKELDGDIAIIVLGQNLTTEVKGGSLAAASVHEGIRIDKKREDAELFRQIREQVLVPWAEYNWGSGSLDRNEAGRDLAPYPQPQIEPPEDEESEGNALKLLGEACKALRDVEPQTDVRAILETHGVPIDESIEIPEPPVVQQATVISGQEQQQQSPKQPSKGEPEQLCALLTAGTKRAMLKAGSAGERRMMRYQDTLAERGRRLAAKAFEPMIEALIADIDGAESMADVKRLVVKHARAHGKSVSEVAKLVERVNIIAHAQGRGAILGKVME